MPQDTPKKKKKFNKQGKELKYHGTVGGQEEYGLPDDRPGYSNSFNVDPNPIDEEQLYQLMPHLRPQQREYSVPQTGIPFLFSGQSANQQKAGPQAAPQQEPQLPPVTQEPNKWDEFVGPRDDLVLNVKTGKYEPMAQDQLQSIASDKEKLDEAGRSQGRYYDRWAKHDPAGFRKDAGKIPNERIEKSDVGGSANFKQALNQDLNDLLGIGPEQPSQVDKDIEESLQRMQGKEDARVRSDASDNKWSGLVKEVEGMNKSQPQSQEGMKPKSKPFTDEEKYQMSVKEQFSKREQEAETEAELLASDRAQFGNEEGLPDDSVQDFSGTRFDKGSEEDRELQKYKDIADAPAQGPKLLEILATLMMAAGPQTKPTDMTNLIEQMRYPENAKRKNAQEMVGDLAKMRNDRRMQESKQGFDMMSQGRDISSREGIASGDRVSREKIASERNKAMQQKGMNKGLPSADIKRQIDMAVREDDAVISDIRSELRQLVDPRMTESMMDEAQLKARIDDANKRLKMAQQARSEKIRKMTGGQNLGMMTGGQGFYGGQPASSPEQESQQLTDEFQRILMGLED